MQMASACLYKGLSFYKIFFFFKNVNPASNGKNTKERGLWMHARIYNKRNKYKILINRGLLLEFVIVKNKKIVLMLEGKK